MEMQGPKKTGEEEFRNISYREMKDILKKKIQE